MSTQVELLTYITRERLRSIWSHVAPYLIHIKNFAMWIWPLLVRAVKFLIRVVKFLLRSTLLVTAFVGAYFMSLMLHAEGHRISLEWIGGKADIDFVYIPSEILMSITKFVPIGSSVNLVIPPANSNHLLVFYFAGGLITAALFFSFWLYARSTRKEGHASWIEVISASIILYHLFFAGSELILLYGNSVLQERLQWVMIGISQIIFLIWYRRHIFPSLRK